ncbi:MAG: hypothetical protein IKZ37_03165 [Bacteroidaceae bacterium]|nr:hypothetical protein [Bacteroidaceae bacterium]
MKTKSFLNLTFLTLMTIGLQSCSTTYFQVYDVETEGLQSSKEKITYSNNDCEIIYDLWCAQGCLNFLFKNNSETDIYIDLSQSFFIRNGIAYDYYVDSEHTKSKTITTGTSASIAKSQEFYGYQLPMWIPTTISRSTQVTRNGSVGTSSSITTKEPKVICIPAKSAKFIESFSISDYILLDCGNIELNKPKKESPRINYIKKDSPLVFRNRLVYYVGQSNEGVTVDNSFWVSGFTNYSKKEFYIRQREDNCFNKNSIKTIEVYKYKSANKFYNEYTFEYNTGSY